MARLPLPALRQACCMCVLRNRPLHWNMTLSPHHSTMTLSPKDIGGRWGLYWMGREEKGNKRGVFFFVLVAVCCCLFSSEPYLNPSAGAMCVHGWGGGERDEACVPLTALFLFKNLIGLNGDRRAAPRSDGYVCLTGCC
ncbi:hypothetical protein MAPG_05692 [Magnaporthiopsis poae ATCC 64411]|uniref:Uncharacterized protein n=1 Tax=Magnaporthiopsis poae (strain ATCC 64411 / 73-15) TaxID=644358 RepID=A0A0C4E026_MAGP6|nr:hypothetical protein MAPG_05692 [Magnaporthiopsis poae ATCC 64411]